jgi:RNA polymerase sigma factor (TIGR02999 family)
VTSDASPPPDLTTYLHRWRDGDQAARDALMPHVYRELRAMARRRLRAERDDHTLDTVALVHEAYLRLGEAGAIAWEDRVHFFAVAASAMRRVLLDHAKTRRRAKRGGAFVRVPLEPERLGDAEAVAEHDPDTLLALDAALAELARTHARQARAVELRYFGGLTLEEVGEALGVSAPTALRDLRFAQAWLADALQHDR